VSRHHKSSTSPSINITEQCRIPNIILCTYTVVNFVAFGLLQQPACLQLVDDTSSSSTSARFCSWTSLWRVSSDAVSSRIHFKLCTLMYDAQHGIAPKYLTELCEHCDDSRLRPSPRGNLIRCPSNPDNAYSVAGPWAWNALLTDTEKSHSHLNELVSARHSRLAFLGSRSKFSLFFINIIIYGAAEWL